MARYKTLQEFADATGADPNYLKGLPGGFEGSLTDQIAYQVKKRPKYNISPEYSQNQATAKSAAFGRDRSIQQQEANIEQESADAVGQARDFSSSTSGLLGALSSVTGSKNAALRGLGADEAAIQNQKLQQLYGANVGMAEERDKAWNYNENQPYQLKLNELAQRRKVQQENLWKVLDTAGSIASFGLMKGGGGGGMMSSPSYADYGL